MGVLYTDRPPSVANLHWHHITERFDLFESTIASNATLVGLVLTAVRIA